MRSATVCSTRSATLNPARVVIDGMQGFERAADLPERLSDVYSAIAQELERRRVTTLYTTETRGLFESDIHVPINGLSAATQNIILLRHVEHRAAILRALAILKVRDDDYDAKMREIKITDDGIRLLDTFDDASNLMSGGGTAELNGRRRARNRSMPGTPSILIVEDEYGLAELLRDMLTELGYEVSLAINGRLALEVLREREIHLVLTDAMMPVMDGPELARAMRADERHRRIPIVMMTSLAAAVPSTPGPLRGGPRQAVYAGCAAEGSEATWLVSHPGWAPKQARHSES